MTDVINFDLLSAVNGALLTGIVSWAQMRDMESEKQSKFSDREKLDKLRGVLSKCVVFAEEGVEMNWHIADLSENEVKKRRRESIELTRNSMAMFSDQEDFDVFLALSFLEGFFQTAGKRSRGDLDGWEGGKSSDRSAALLFVNEQMHRQLLPQIGSVIEEEINRLHNNVLD